MVKLKKLINKIDYFGLEESEIQKCNQDIRLENLRMLRYVSFVASVFSIVFGIIPLMLLNRHDNAKLIIWFTVISLIYCFISGHKNKDSEVKKITYTLIYSYNFFAYMTGIYITCTVGSDNASVLFILLLAVLHAFYLIKPTRAFNMTLLVTILFCIASYISKDYSFFLQDVRNAVVGMALSQPLNYMNAKMRMQVIVSKNKVKSDYTELYNSSAYDGLTGVYTKAVITEQMEEYCTLCTEGKNNIFFAMMDVDYFKQYNDTYGHLLGDATLKKIGNILKQATSNYDISVGRVGGEEFLILGKVESEMQAVRICEAIKFAVEALQEEHRGSYVTDYVTISVGVVYAGAGRECEATKLYDYADKALYAAKKDGRNRVKTY